jgi:transcriptional regulator with XRE-family HTH domain
MEKHQHSWSRQLRHERELRGWSQEQVAGKIDTDPKAVGRWERGEKFPSLKYRALLCELYNKTTEELGLISENTDMEATDTPTYAHAYWIDWGEAPANKQLYGRDSECAQLEMWLMDNESRVVAVLGTGGIGKTALAVTVTDQARNTFEYIFWRSLQNAPHLEHILQKCILFLSKNEHVDLANDVEDQISQLITYLREHRCLLVLDNIEAVLQCGDEVGHWCQGYEGYGRLIKRLGEAQHQSCLLLTSREKPKEVAHAEGRMSPVRSLQLTGLELAEAREILQDIGLFGTDDAWKALVYFYSGNPLALKLVSGTVREVFGGDITRFLKQGKAVFGDVSVLLKQQFQRLTVLEREILYWLSVEREAVSLEHLKGNIVRVASKGAVVEALDSLRRRYMLETSNVANFTLQPVIMEYVTNELVERICREIATEKPKLLANHALIMAQAKDYIRESQIRLILTPVAQWLIDTLGKEHVEDSFRKMLTTLRDLSPQRPGYTAGNLLNLLLHIQSDLYGYDFSRLQVRQAYLRGRLLREVNFAYANLATSVFTDTFGNILSVAFSSDGAL